MWAWFKYPVYVYDDGLELIKLYYVGPESTDIDLGQAQQKSASMLNVLRALTPAEFVENEKYGEY